MSSREPHSSGWELRTHLCSVQRTAFEHVTHSEALKSKRPPALSLENSEETKGNEWVETVEGDRKLNGVKDYSCGRDDESDLSLKNEEKS